MLPNRRIILAIAAVIGLFGLILPMTFASAVDPDPADNTLRLQMANGLGTFTYQDGDPGTPNDVQHFSASKQCAPVFKAGDPTLVELGRAPSTGAVGFSTQSLGVKVPGEGNSGKCEQANVPNQVLRVKVGSALAGKTFDFAELDIEAKFDAAINIALFNGDPSLATQVNAVPLVAVADDPSTPLVDESRVLVISCTGSGSDCGPDDSARDNFRVRAPSAGAAEFTEMWLWATATNTSGAVALEGGADQTLPLDPGLGSQIGTSDTIFHVTPTPALSVTKTADDGNDADSTGSASESFTAGEDIGFTIRVENGPGGETATDVSLTDVLPAAAGTAWVESPDQAGCSITGNVLSCSVATLPANASFSVHVTSPTTTETIADSPIENTASVTAANAAGTITASASALVWSGVIDCVDDPETADIIENEASATDPVLADVTVTRHANIDGAACTPKNYLIRTAEEIVTGEDGEVNVVTFLEDLESGQDAHYTMQIDWTYERRDPVADPDANPATVGGRTFYIDFDGSGTFVPAELCPVVDYDAQGDPVPAMHPAGLPWCITGQSYTIDESGLVVLQQEWDGLGDPRSY